MRILQVVNTLSATDGGPARNSFELNQALNGRTDCSAQLWAITGGESESTPAVDTRSGRVLRGPVPIFSGSLPRLARAVRSCDVIVVHGFYLWWVPVLLLVARVLRTPVVIMPHGAISAYEMRKSTLKKRGFDVATSLAGVRRAQFAVGSQSEAHDVTEIRPRARVTVVGVGTPLPEPSPPRDADERRGLSLVSVSRIAPKKRIDLMIDAVARATERGVDVTLVVAGDGDPQLKRRLESQAVASGVAERVSFVGHVGAEAKAELFREADIFLLPSEDENFGIGLAEALSYGVPAVVSDRVAAAHEVGGGAVQMLHDPTGDSIADAIEQWADPAARRSASEAAASEARRAFDWRAVAERWSALLGSAIAPGTPRGARPTIVYVSTSYPSFSETFVSSEMESLRRAGWNVFSYSLRKPPAELTATVPYLLRPVGRLALVPWVVAGFFLRMTSWRGGARLRRNGSLKGFARGLFLDAHAARMRRGVRRMPDRPIGFHAHFLAQPAEVAARAARALPVVVTVHAADASVEDTAENRLFVRNVSGFRFASRAVERTFNLLGEPGESIVLPCVAALPERREAREAADGVLRVVTVARLVETKGYRRMMRIVEEAASRGRVEWTIVGDGAMRSEIDEWRRSAEGPGLAVSLEGARPHDETLKLLASADVFFLLPETSGEALTKGDGLPVALMEAMACGVPVVSSAAGGIPELVQHGVTGVLVPPDDDTAAIEALWAANRTDESSRLVEAGRDLVMSSFSPEATSAMLSDWLETRFDRTVVAS